MQYILDSVIPQLLADPSKRFIYVEVAFFAHWWQLQTEEMRQAVRRLISEGKQETQLCITVTLSCYPCAFHISRACL